MENEDEERLRYSLKVICSKAHIFGVKFTHIGPRYQFNCQSSVDSLSPVPEVWKVTDYWGEQYESNDLLIEGVKVYKTRFFESCATAERSGADELIKNSGRGVSPNQCRCFVDAAHRSPFGNLLPENQGYIVEH